MNVVALGIVLVIVYSVLWFFNMGNLFWSIIPIIVVLAFLSGIRILRPTERGLVERFGKYNRFSGQGFNLIIPFVEGMVRVNITEQLEDVDEQEIITQDRLNATIDAQVYYKVKDNEDAVKKSQYNVNDYKYQIVSLAKTTLRNIIGNMSYQDANSKRRDINTKLQSLLTKEAEPWGLQIVRTEIKEISPPKDVQDSMNNLIKAENTKKAALDLATAAETEADGKRRANIKNAEGMRQSEILVAEGKRQATILEAEGQAQAIQKVNQSIQKNFRGQAVTYKKLETAATAMKRGTKIIVPQKANLVNVIAEAAGVTPIPISGKGK